MTRWLIHMCILGMCSVEDWKEKRISLWKIELYAGIVLIYEIWCLFRQRDEISVWALKCMTGILPGIVMLLLGRLSKEAIGYGDGYITLIIGFSTGFWKLLGILGTAFLGVMCVAVYLIWIKKKNRNSQIAFVPFLFLGMAGTKLWIGI